MTTQELLELLRNEQDPERRQAIVDQAMESLTPQNLERFVTEAGDELTPEQRDRIRTYRERQPGAVEQSIADQADSSQFVEDEAQRRATETADSMFDAATADGRTITAEEAAAIEEATGLDRRPDKTPKWMLDANGASYWTEDQKQRLVEYVNFYQGGNFRSFDDLLTSGYLNEPTALNQQTVQAAILDDEPFQSLSVSMPGGDVFTVEAREWESAQAMYGVDSRDLTKIVRVANQVGAMDTTGKPAWQLMTALMKATGMLGSITDPQRAIRRRSFNEPSPTRSPFDLAGRIEDALARPDPQGATGARRPGEIISRREDAVGEEITDETPLGFDEAGIPVSRFARPRTAAELSYSINEGMRLYDDSLAMSYIHVLDPQLAAKIKMGARNPGMFTRADQNKLFDLVALSGAPTTEDFRTQLILQGEARLQGDSNDMYGNYLDYLLGAGDGGDGGRGGSGAQVIKSRPDPASLDERLRELYQTMFFTEPSDDDLARFRSQINSAIDAAGPGDQVDWGARANQFARNDPRYADLYGKMPETMSEGDFRMQFEAGQASMLGAERAGNAAVMAGMRDGNFQTTIGAAAGTTEAWDNSTFLDRLARASRAVSEMT